MIRLIGLGAALLAVAGVPAAQTYKWVDDRGVITYGEKPPAGKRAVVVDTQPGGTLESGALRQSKPKTVPQKTEIQLVVPPAAAPAPVRGLDFSVFIQLQTGMSEGELVLRAGKPDQESVENFRHNVVKYFYYYPTLANPYITLITLSGGRITNIERTKKTF